MTVSTNNENHINLAGVCPLGFVKGGAMEINARVACAIFKRCPKTSKFASGRKARAR